MKKINIKVSIINMLLFINCISTMGIPCLGNYINKISYYYFAISITSGLLIFILKPKINIQGFFKYIFLYYLILLLPTIVYKNDIYLLLCEMGMNTITILIWNSMNKNEFKQYLPVISFALEILAYLNLIIVLVYPDGLYNQGYIRSYYLFGHVNIAIRYLLPGCFFNFLRSINKTGKFDLRSKLYFAAVCLTLLLTFPVTAIIGLIVFILCFKVLSLKKDDRVLTPISGFYSSLVLSFLIVYVQIQNIFNKLIINIFHKDLTLSGRTEIWNLAIESIKERIILGCGRLTIDNRVLVFKATSAHNQFLIFLSEGGLCLLVIIFFLIKAISKRIEKYENMLAKRIVISVIMAYLFMWITEPFSYSGTILMFLVFLFSYYGDIIFDKK